MNLKQLKQYYLKSFDGEQQRIIKQLLLSAEPLVVYGGQSVNVRLPDYLQGATADWDIYSHTAKETAEMLEHKLDTEFGGDYFEVLPAKHQGTFRVISKVTNKAVADITLPDQTIEYQVIEGIRYATLDEQVAKIKAILKDPEAMFRWSKDRETLQRIELFQKDYPTLWREPPIHKMHKKHEAVPTVKGW